MILSKWLKIFIIFMIINYSICNRVISLRIKDKRRFYKVRLTHNMFSLRIYKTYKGRIEDNAKASNNINTGSKLSAAKDNPAKIGNNENLKIQVLTNDAASKNIQDANSMIQTYDGALQ